MIQYDRLWATMAAKGMTQYRLIKVHGFSAGQIGRLKKNMHVSTHTIDTLCTLLDCSISDIVEYIPDAAPLPSEASDQFSSDQTASDPSISGQPSSEKPSPDHPSSEKLSSEKPSSEKPSQKGKKTEPSKGEKAKKSGKTKKGDKKASKGDKKRDGKKGK